MILQWKNKTNTICREFFQVSLITYLCLTLAEAGKEGFVSNFFNMNYLLLTVLVAGLGMVLTEPAESDLRRAMETAATEVVRARRVVHNRVVRPAVDTIQTISATKVIDLRDTRPGSAGYGPDRRDNPYKRGKH